MNEGGDAVGDRILKPEDSERAILGSYLVKLRNGALIDERCVSDKIEHKYGVRVLEGATAFRKSDLQKSRAKSSFAQAAQYGKVNVH